MGVADRGDSRTPRPPTTWCGRATSTRSPPRCTRPATARARRRALDFLFNEQQKPDGCFPQNSNRRRHQALGQPPARRGRPPDRARVAARPPRRDHLRARQARGRLHPRQRPADAAGALGEPGRRTRPPRSPRRSRRSSARPRLARLNGDTASAAAWEAKADEWQAKVDDWTYTTTGPYGSGYYLRLTKDGKPERGHDLRHRRQRAGGRRPAQGRGPELPRARAPRDQARRRSADRLDAARGRPAARGRHAATAATGTASTSTATASRRTAASGTSASRPTRPSSGRTTPRSGASGRSSRASAVSTSSPRGSQGRPVRGSPRWRAPVARGT